MTNANLTATEPSEIHLSVILNADEAKALAAALRRAGYSDYKNLSDTTHGDAPVYAALMAGDKVVGALYQAGAEV